MDAGVEDPEFTVARYRAVAACDGFTTEQLVEHALPEGFPLLVNTTTGGIVGPVFSYLWHRAARTPRLSLSSAVGAADNLRIWWGYLAYRRLEWDRVTSADIERFRSGLSRAVSPRTGGGLSEGTVRQRMTHLASFYQWASERNLVRLSGEFLSSPEARSGGRPLESRVHAFTYDEWALLRPLVGPLPTDEAYDPVVRPCRDRLTWELILHCGMRRSELCAISVVQVRALLAQIDSTSDEFAAKTVKLTVVKGGASKARDAIIPVWLVRELGRYLDGPERRAAARAYAAKHLTGEPQQFFLNHAGGKRAPGAPLKPGRLDEVFNAIMRKVGMVERVAATDPVTGEVYERVAPLHHVHDLRHTAAVWRYMVERLAGNSTPWKPVQVMLGHTDWQTTERYYLKVTNVFEAATSDAALNFFRGVAHGIGVGHP